MLRVLNDDTVAAGKGFDRHPHENMEIISIPLEGDLEHRDSMGNVQVIRSGDVQVMSAGTGILHSEYNHSSEAQVKFLQIWVHPNKRNVAPRYDQISLNPGDRHNTLQQILSPDPSDDGVWIHQDAWFHVARLAPGVSLPYAVKQRGNGVYAFVLSGQMTIQDLPLGPRDGLGMWDVDSIGIRADSEAELLLMDVPMR